MSASRKPTIEPVPGVGFRVRIRYGKGLRDRFAIKLADETAASKRAETMAELARMLTKAGHSEQCPLLLTKLGEADEGKAREIRNLAQKLCLGQARVAGRAPADTFRQLAAQWTSGKLAARFPDHVAVKKSVESDVHRLGVLYRTIGDVPLATFRLEDAERAMASLPASARAPATRRQYAQLIARVLGLAVYPCRIIPRSPIPKGFLPAQKSQKATAWLFPDEEQRLQACAAIPLERRVLYGLLAREGMRVSEALALRWSDLDLDRGTVRLDTNKTEESRSWVLTPGVAPALKAWRGSAEPQDRPFACCEAEHQADQFRADLLLAGVDRPELFERTEHRRPIRIHDLRATFVTLSLASGRSETWVADRTGHRSTLMIGRYRRQARQASELGLGELIRLDLAIPELASRLCQGGPKSGPALFGDDAGVSEKSSIFSALVAPPGLEPGCLAARDFKSPASAISPRGLGFPLNDTGSLERSLSEPTRFRAAAKREPTRAKTKAPPRTALGSRPQSPTSEGVSRCTAAHWRRARARDSGAWRQSSVLFSVPVLVPVTLGCGIHGSGNLVAFGVRDVLCGLLDLLDGDQLVDPRPGLRQGPRPCAGCSSALGLERLAPPLRPIETEARGTFRQQELSPNRRRVTFSHLTEDPPPESLPASQARTRGMRAQ